MAMAGVGEATAIIAVVQLGFSFATALNTYVSEVKGAREDLLGLASDIEATLGQLRDLGRLIKDNKLTNYWSEDGLKGANKCITRCETVLEKLRKLLLKSAVSEPTSTLKREDIDVSKFGMAAWPFVKPEVEVRRRELLMIKTDILLAYNSYMTKAGSTEDDRNRSRSDLAGLARTRYWVVRQLNDAKKRQREQTGSVGDSPKDSQWLRRSSQTRNVSFGPHANINPSKRDDKYDDDVRRGVYEAEKEIRMNIAEEDARKRKDEEEKKAAAIQAVEVWKREKLKEAQDRKQAVEESRNRLRTELSSQKLLPQKIEQIISDLYPHRPEDDLFWAIAEKQEPNKNARAPNLSEVGITQRRYSGRRLFRRFRRSPVEGPASSTLKKPNRRDSENMPDLFYDPTALNGVAALEAFYFTPEPLGDFRWLAMDLPEQELLGRLIRTEETKKKPSNRMNAVWKKFALLPDSCKMSIVEWLQRRNDALHSWVLLFLETIQHTTRRGLLGLTENEQYKGVYVVFKRQPRTERLLPDQPESSPTKVGTQDDYPQPREPPSSYSDDRYRVPEDEVNRGRGGFIYDDPYELAANPRQQTQQFGRGFFDRTDSFRPYPPPPTVFGANGHYNETDQTSRGDDWREASIRKAEARREGIVRGEKERLVRRWSDRSQPETDGIHELSLGSRRHNRSGADDIDADLDYSGVRRRRQRRRSPPSGESDVERIRIPPPPPPPDRRRRSPLVLGAPPLSDIAEERDSAVSQRWKSRRSRSSSPDSDDDRLNDSDDGSQAVLDDSDEKIQDVILHTYLSNHAHRDLADAESVVVVVDSTDPPPPPPPPVDPEAVAAAAMTPLVNGHTDAAELQDPTSEPTEDERREEDYAVAIRPRRGI